MKECISEYEDVPWEEIPTYIEEPLSNKENEKIIGMNRTQKMKELLVHRFVMMYYFKLWFLIKMVQKIRLGY